MTCEILFAVASLIFAISTAIPIGLFAFHLHLDQEFRNLMIILYIPPAISGLAAVIAGVLTIGTHFRSVIPNWTIAIWDLLAIVAILITSIFLPYGIFRYIRFMVERSADRIYTEALKKEGQSI